MNERFKKLFSNLHVTDLVYPSISVFLLVILVIVFFVSVKFLYTQIDSVLSLDTGEEPSLLRLDMESLSTVAHKLSIPIRSATSSVSGETTNTPIETEKVPTEKTETSVTPAEPNRASVRIAVYNSTPTAGVAGKLKSALESEKFVVAEVGNKTPALETTLVQTKASLNTPLISAITAVVSKSYTVSAEILPPDSPFDVIITIGAK